MRDETGESYVGLKARKEKRPVNKMSTSGGGQASRHVREQVV